MEYVTALVVPNDVNFFAGWNIDGVAILYVAGGMNVNIVRLSLIVIVDSVVAAVAFIKDGFMYVTKIEKKHIILLRQIQAYIIRTRIRMVVGKISIHTQRVWNSLLFNETNDVQRKIHFRGK
uniref:Uncharacterized protein n=1 Tax=Glossina austeni TaxID=7395 RepID=A0A1A9VBN7_GLOAU